MQMMPVRPCRLFRPTTIALSLSVPALFITTRTMAAAGSSKGAAPSNSQSFPITPYKARNASFPYTKQDFQRADESDDDDFYDQPRFVTHIDDHAIDVLKSYYSQNLPKAGRILDLCSSWISHLPPELEETAVATVKRNNPDDNGTTTGRNDYDLEVIGMGMNDQELKANPVLTHRILQNLNKNPDLPQSLAPLDATTCVVSIDYLTCPMEILSSIRNLTKPGGIVHLIISNRCFPTKAVGRWLRVSEEERLRMVGDYLWFSGWRNIEIVEVSDGKSEGNVGGLMGMMGFEGKVDPLWVVRGVNIGGGEVKSEL